MTLILLCGYGMTTRAYRPLIKHLEQRHKVHAIDFVDVDPVKIDSYLEKIDREVKKLNRDTNSRFVLMGHSFGGALATLFMHQNLESVAKLILTNSVGIPPTGYAQFLQPRYTLESEYFTTLAGRVIVRTFARSWLAHPWRMAQWLKLIRHIDLRQIYPQIKTPTDVWWSDHDRFFKEECGREIVQLVPRADFHIVKGSHAWPIITPELLKI